MSITGRFVHWDQVEPIIKESKELNWVKKNIDLGLVVIDKA